MGLYGESGDILPGLARYRLESLRRAHQETGAWTSNLSASEALLVQEAGGQLLGQVMGAAVFQLGRRWPNTGRAGMTGEVTALSEAYLGARHEAIARLEAEAAVLGANAIVGVRITLGRVGRDRRSVQFSATGTAVRKDDWPTGSIAVSSLSGQDFWRLVRMGYRPCGLVFGICAYTVNRGFTRPVAANLYNRELEGVTLGLQDAIRLAKARIEDDVRDHGAFGSVGMKIEVDVAEIEWDGEGMAAGGWVGVDFAKGRWLRQAWIEAPGAKQRYSDFVMVCMATGTAIEPMGEPKLDPGNAPLLMLDLQAGIRRPLEPGVPEARRLEALGLDLHR